MLSKPFRWPGGKGNALKKLLPLIPVSTGYCEPFAGSATLFFARDPVEVEVLNDMDERIVNFFRVLQDDALRRKLIDRLEYTPYARAEFERALLAMESNEPIEKAWGFFVSMNQAKSGSLPRHASDFGYAKKEGVAVQFARKAARLDAIAARLKRAIIERVDGINCVHRYDSDEMVFYVDPPYARSTRKTIRLYKHEVDDAYHDRLVDALLSARGMVVLSGYHCEPYDRLIAAGWTMLSFEARCHISDARVNGPVTRMECVYINPRAVAWHKKEGTFTLC